MIGKGKATAISGIQNNVMGIETNRHPRSPARHVMDATRLAIAPIHQNQVSGTNRILPQGMVFPCGLILRFG